MKQWTALGASSALALLLGTTAVQADVSAEQVWQGWVDYYSASGQTVTSESSAMEGDTLVVKNAEIASKPNEAGTFKITLSEVRLRETGDGRVEITLPAEMPMTFSGKDPDGKTIDTSILATQSGLLITASGAPEDITYDTAAAKVGIALDSAEAEGEKLPATVNLTMNDITGKSHIIRSSGFEMEQSFAAQSADVKIAASSETDGKKESFDLVGTLNSLSGSSRAHVTEGADMAANMAAALNAGTNMSGEFIYGGGSYAMSFNSAEQGAGKFDYKDTSGKIHFNMSKDGLSYGGESGAAEMVATVPNLPVSLELAIGSSMFDLAIPVSKSDAPQPYKLVTKLIDLKVSDAIWDMFDPTRQLPRDPATLVVDASGNGTLQVDLFDPATAEAAAAPGQINDVSLNELKLSVAGAELTGTGQATIDNSGTTPKPVGTADLKLVGANGLMDKLVAIQLVTEEQVMGFRMMLGVFTVPAGDDILTSKIEAKEDGSISANGQRLQ
jgi:hypothetical protein